MSRTSWRRGAWALAAVVCVMSSLARADDTPLLARRYADGLAAKLGISAPAHVEPLDRGGGKGVRVELDGVTAERLRFDSPEQAQHFARGLVSDEPGLVDVRGKQVLLVHGASLVDPVRADLALESGWEGLPSPNVPSVVRELGRAPARRPVAAAPPPTEPPPLPGPVVTARSTSKPGTFGVEELLGHYLNGKELAPRRAREVAVPMRSPSQQLASTVAAVATSTIPAHQQGRAVAAYDAMSASDQEAVDRLLEEHSTRPEVRDQLLKALGASSSLEEITSLADDLAMHDAAWIKENTRLTGAAGLKQQFGESCAPTTVQALRGEYDPAYALRTRNGNVDVNDVDPDRPFDKNTDLAREQKALLEQPYAGALGGLGQKGVAASRNARAGSGRHVDDLMNSLKDRTGIEYEYHGLTTPSTAVAVMKQHLAEGRVVPFVVTDSGATGSHAAMATSVRSVDGRSSFLVYEPWNGGSTWVPEEDFVNNNLKVAGWDRVYYVLEPKL